MQLAINGQPIQCNEKHKAPAKTSSCLCLQTPGSQRSYAGMDTISIHRLLTCPSAGLRRLEDGRLSVICIPDWSTPGETMIQLPDNGLIHLSSRHTVMETFARLETVVQAKGLTILARIDHSGDAAGSGTGQPRRPDATGVAQHPQRVHPLDRRPAGASGEGGTARSGKSRLHRIAR